MTAITKPIPRKTPEFYNGLEVVAGGLFLNSFGLWIYGHSVDSFSFVLCLWFWLAVCSSSTIMLYVDREKRKWLVAPRALSLIGILSNATVMLVNSGKMPVLGLKKPEGMWTPVTSHTNLRPLADIYWLGSSIGDIILLCSALVWFSAWLIFRRPTKESA